MYIEHFVVCLGQVVDKTSLFALSLCLDENIKLTSTLKFGGCFSLPKQDLTFPHDRRGASYGFSGWQSHAPLEGACTLCTGGTSCGSSAGRYGSETWHTDGYGYRIAWQGWER